MSYQTRAPRPGSNCQPVSGPISGLLPFSGLVTICLSLFFANMANAISLEGEELQAYDAYCPAGNTRAVWAELPTPPKRLATPQLLEKLQAMPDDETIELLIVFVSGLFCRPARQQT